MPSYFDERGLRNAAGACGNVLFSARYPMAIGAALLLCGCGKPPYPDNDAVRDRFQVEYRNAQCELVKIHPPKRQPESAGYRHLYLHIRIEARCKNLSGTEERLVRKQVWKLDPERPTLFQGAWRWEPAGEISD